MYYFLAFVLMALCYIFFHLAAFSTNDDWMLQNLLKAKGIYGTLIMSYPLSYSMSKLYDILPTVQWYSWLMTSLLIFYSYLMSLYISRADNWTQKIFLFIASALLLTYMWFHLSITAITILTMIVALGFVKVDLRYSFAFVFLASLLRIEMLYYFLPFYIIGLLVLRGTWKLKTREAYALVLLIALIISSVYLQRQDTRYTQWLSFNKARAMSNDLQRVDTKNILSQEQKILLQAGWVQDEKLLPLKKVLEASPSLVEVLWDDLGGFDYSNFLHYRLNLWFILLFVSSIYLMSGYRKNKMVFLMLLFVFGVMALIIIRDVDRVTVPLFVLWALIIYESIDRNKIIKNSFIVVFTVLFAYYSSPGLKYRDYQANIALKSEARKLIADSGIASEPAINFPTYLTLNMVAVFSNNFLFREKDWLRIDESEILPNAWLLRHEYFYKTHSITVNGIKRKHIDYHSFLIDEKTGFFGGKELLNNEGSDFLLRLYDREYLADKPECRHAARIVSSSSHFAISQIVIVCSDSN